MSLGVILTSAACGLAPDPVPSPSPSSSPISVTDFGAEGSGNADDRPAIQRALDAGAKSGREVHFPAGLYFLGSATAPGDHLLRTYPGQRLIGAGSDEVTLKIASRTPAYRAVIATASPSIEVGTWVMRGLTIDQSAMAGNLLSIPEMAKYPRMAVQVGSHNAGSAISVTDNGFVDSDSVNIVYVFAEHVDVSRNRFSSIGGVVGGPVHDHSSVYVTVTQPEGVLIIRENQFNGNRGSSGARTAVETHGGRQVVTGNSVDGYLRGANVTGVAGAPSDSIIVQGNKVVDAMIGVQVWALEPEPGVLGRGQLGTVAIAGNDLGLSSRHWLSSYPKLFPVAVLVNTSNDSQIRLLSVIRNRIAYEQGAGSVAVQPPGVVVCRTSTPAGQVKSVQVIDNDIERAPAPLADEACRGSAFIARENRTS
ncbi:glycosyl hydrolase family 28-related protein [Propionibacteriaceae bacterium Y1685]|uniref:glycosyl hydrolase family 28-related protein n=1 Tax=Microlunatus sp. Y1700 TaxID=3418487 RepID=UPI003B8201AC